MNEAPTKARRSATGGFVRPAVVVASGVLVVGLVAVTVAVAVRRAGPVGETVPMEGGKGSVANLGTGLVSGARVVTGVSSRLNGGEPIQEAGSNGVSDPRRAPLNPYLIRLDTAFREVEAEKDPEKRAKILEALAAGIPDAQLGLALAVLTDPAFPAAGRDLRQRLFRRWGETDPEAAATWVGRMSEGERRTEAIGSLAQGWAAKDAGRAMAWAQQLAASVDRVAAVVEVAYEIARTEPVRALTTAVTLPEAPRRDELIHYAAAQWAAQSPVEAAQWAGRISEPVIRDRVLADVLTAWGESDPSAAAEAAVRSMAPGRSQNDAVVAIVQRWTQSDPAMASAWVEKFPAGELGETAAEEMSRLWAGTDPAKAGAWLNSLAPGAIRDAAVVGFVSQVVVQAPESAAEWAAGIGDEARRAVEMERVAERWLQADPGAARAWIERSKFTAEARARLLAPVDPPKP